MKLGSGNRTWWASFVLAVAGLINAVYLTWVKLANAYASCLGIGDCELVNQSRFAEFWGQPVALWGALSYLVIVLALVAERRLVPAREIGPLVVFGVSTFWTLYSGYLTYIEVAVLYAICPYCVLSAVIMTVIWGLSILRLRSQVVTEDA
jgi:uncharacterized membrane protein